MTFDLAFVIRFLLAALAVYRVAMFTREDGPFWIFAFIRKRLGKLSRASKRKHGVWQTLDAISKCPHCVGVWLALITAPFVVWPDTPKDFILFVFVFLALAGAQSYLTRRNEEE